AGGSGVVPADTVAKPGRSANTDELNRIVPPVPGNGIPHFGQMPVSAAASVILVSHDAHCLIVRALWSNSTRVASGRSLDAAADTTVPHASALCRSVSCLSAAPACDSWRDVVAGDSGPGGTSSLGCAGPAAAAWAGPEGAVICGRSRSA